MTKLDWRTGTGVNLGKVLDGVKRLYEEDTVSDNVKERDKSWSMNKADISIYTDVDRYEVASDSKGYVWLVKYHNDETEYRMVTCSSNKFLSKIFDIDKIVRTDDCVY